MANILAIETSSDACSVSLSFDNYEYHFHEILPKQHTERLLIEIKLLLKLASAQLQDLDAIAVGCGPGSFTGIRLACSIAQGLAFSNNLKTIQISSLEVLAKNINTKLGAGPIVSIVDARMQQLYIGEFSYSKEGLVSSDIFVLPVEEFNSSVYEENTFFVGDGCDLVRKELTEISTNIFLNLPLAEDLLSIAKDKYTNNELLEPAELLPMYLFGEDQWKKAK
jgi:tRNA threonylcarbamoyladenosine biosynthesis protein TsaB